MSKATYVLAQALAWSALTMLPAIAITAALAWALSPGTPTPATIAQSDGLERFDMLMVLSSQLKSGMAKYDVEELMGLPDNEDSKYIWYWCCDARSRGKYSTWRQLYQCGGGPQAYLLFDEDERLLVAAMPKAAEGSPWDAYRGFLLDGTGRVSYPEAVSLVERLLGRPDPDADPRCE